jgi:hypothetical protein
MVTQSTETPAMLFEAKNTQELLKEIRNRHGDAVARILERVDTKRLSVDDQAATVKQLHDAGMNGNASALLDAYNVHNRQFEVKSVVDDKWYHKVGRGVKDVLLAPVRGVKWAFTKHPVISTVALTALLAFLGYHYGLPMAQFAGEGGDSRVQGVANTLRRLVQFSPAGDMPGTGEVMMPPPVYPEIVPPSIPLPDR